MKFEDIEFEKHRMYKDWLASKSDYPDDYLPDLSWCAFYEIDTDFSLSILTGILAGCEPKLHLDDINNYESFEVKLSVPEWIIDDNLKGTIFENCRKSTYFINDKITRQQIEDFCNYVINDGITIYNWQALKEFNNGRTIIHPTLRFTLNIDKVEKNELFKADLISILLAANGWRIED